MISFLFDLWSFQNGKWRERKSFVICNFSLENCKIVGIGMFKLAGKMMYCHIMALWIHREFINYTLRSVLKIWRKKAYNMQCIWTHMAVFHNNSTVSCNNAKEMEPFLTMTFDIILFWRVYPWWCVYENNCYSICKKSYITSALMAYSLLHRQTCSMHRWLAAFLPEKYFLEHCSK